MAFQDPIANISDGSDLSLRIRGQKECPIWGEDPVARQCSVQMFSSLTLLESTCRRMVMGVASNTIDEEDMRSLRQRAEDYHVDVADSFDSLYCTDISIVDYMDRARLSTLFPKTRALLDEPPGPLPKSRVMMDTYFQHFAMLNQLSTMAKQIKHEIRNMPSHKYIAHQVAMLYQCLASAGDPMLQVKKKVEARFSDLKDATRSASAAKTESGVPVVKLPVHLAAWLEELLGEILEILETLPPIYRNPMVRPVRYMEQQIREF
eukprot:m.94539 g.94539  ORF g.94539 m.94539 type:complete len:263 (+) comp16547_c0_seq1:240-1028(+)